MCKIHIPILILCFLAACAPSAQVIQTAVAKTHAAWTPTPTFTFTPTPSPTSTSTPRPTATPTDLPTKVPYILYYDDFSNKKSGWLNNSSYGANYQYSDGQYIISRPKGNYQNWSYPGQYFSDAVLTVDVKLISGDVDLTGPIIIWRYVDSNNYYELSLVTGSRYFSISKLFKGEWQTLQDWTRSYAINSNNDINKIAISFSGGTITIYINSRMVASVIDTSFANGYIGLGAYSEETSAVEVSFDNLVIYTVESWTPPK